MGRSKSNTLSKHTAVPAMSGYLYQLQLACLKLFDLREGEALGIEVLDDIHVERDGTPSLLGQSKYQRRPKNMTSRSPDLWKTLGIWARAISDGSLDMTSIQQLILMTHANVSMRSFPGLIAVGTDPEVLINALATLGTFKGDSKAGYDAVMALPPEILRMFVERLYVHANLPGLTGVTEELKRTLRRHGFHERTMDLAVQRLYGWLWDEMITSLESKDGRLGVLITESKFHIAQCKIRDELIEERLPVRYAEAELPDFDLPGQNQKVYMRQLVLIGATGNVKRRSISAYFRASSERADWTERGEVLPNELKRYDRELTDRWSQEFDCLCEDIQQLMSEADLRKKCQQHFQTIEHFEIPIRPGWLHKYLTTGSYHLLADRKHVGWHPHYLTLLDEDSREAL